MKRVQLAIVLMLSLAVLSIRNLGADVKTQEKSLVKFEGMLGRMVGLFGGKTAKEGLVSTVAVKGDRKMTLNDTTGEIIDLAEEKVYSLDVRNKTYQVTTFAELRRRMEEARAKAEEAARKAPKDTSEPARPDPSEKQIEVDFTVKESGQTRTIAGYDCREVVMDVTVREKGKTLEQSGGMVLTANSWLAPRIAAMKEIAEFDLRYATKLQGPLGLGGSAEQMAAALAMYPGLKQALGKFQAESVNLDGTPILTVTTIEAVKSPEQVAQETRAEEDSGGAPAGLGGMLGGLGKRLARKKAEGDGGPKTRATFMTTNLEVLSVSTDVAPADVAIPAGYRQK